MNKATRSLKQITPHLGASNYHHYNGSIYEGQRSSNCYTLCLFVEGRGFTTIESKSFPVESGTLMFIRPGQIHSFQIDQSPLSAFNLHFDLWEQSDEAKSVQPQFTLLPRVPRMDLMTRQEECPELDSFPARFNTQPFPALQEGLIHIQRIFDQTVHYRYEAVNALLYSWMLQWFNILHAPRPTDKRIVQLINEMECLPATPISYEEWCNKSGLQKTYFYALFKKETGLTPKAYLLKVKMKKAASLLLESNKSIIAIADELGYKSIHYFSKQFHAYYRMTPTSYRNRIWTS